MATQGTFDCLGTAHDERTKQGRRILPLGGRAGASNRKAVRLPDRIGIACPLSTRDAVERAARHEGMTPAARLPRLALEAARKRQERARVAPTVAVLTALWLPVTAEGQLGYTSFELYTGCAPVGLLVTMAVDSVPSLTRSDVEISARSRLRGARIFDGPVRVSDLHERRLPFLQVTIGGYGPAYSFSVQLALSKPVRDTLSGASGMAITWRGIRTEGRHGGDGGYVLQSLAQRMDEFIDEYLAANERACG